MQTDLGLTDTVNGYELADPITDAQTRMRNRFRVQFLSYRCNGRGSYFVDALNAGRIRNNAAVITHFAQSAAAIITDMQELAQDVYPTGAVLDDFETTDFKTITLYFTVKTREGNMQDTLVVSSVVVEES